MPLQASDFRATLLVVDDSPVDREVLRATLAEDDRLVVETAENGRAAFARIAEGRPDLVVTDLLMPGMNGLELVAALGTDYPDVPVILVTSQGSEELAVKALRAGAASYVPKRSVATDLLATAQEVLSASRHRRSLGRLRGLMTLWETRFVIDNDVALIRPLVAHLQDACRAMGLLEPTDDTRVGVALEEALTNAMFHGNLEVDSTLREGDANTFWHLAEERRQRMPWAARRIRVEARLTPEQAVIQVRDEGSGFDPTSLPNPLDPANLRRVSGRGILLMRAFMDEVAFNERGNAVTLVKRRPATPAAS